MPSQKKNQKLHGKTHAVRSQPDPHIMTATHRAYWVPGTLSNAFCPLSHLTLTHLYEIISYHYNPHFTDSLTEARGGEVTCPGWHHYYMVE